MRILHISDIDLSVRGGGMNTIIPELLTEQQKENPEVDIELLLVNNSQPNYPVIFKIWYYTNHNECITQISKADLMIFHSVYNLKFIHIYQLAMHYKIPYIIVSHGAFSPETQQKGKLKKLLYRKLFLNKFVKNSLALSFLCIDEQKRSIYSWKRHIIVPNVIQISPTRIDNNTTINSDTIHITYMSKISFRYKGLEMMLKALASIKDELNNINLVINIYGYGESKTIDMNNIPKSEHDIHKLLNAIKFLQLENKVFYHGPVFGEAKSVAINQSDIMILPSMSEGMPLTVIEFLACGIPCIVTHNTNMGSLITDNNAGWVCKFDQNDMASAILQAIKSYNMQKNILKQNARKAFEKVNSINIGKTSIEAYRNLLSNQE